MTLDSTCLPPDSVRSIKLPSGRSMPVAAYGTFHSDWAQALMKDATIEAIRLGWRHLDTARAYENEDIVGESIRESIRKGYIKSREELFITGKLWNGHMTPKDVAPALERTSAMKRLSWQIKPSTHASSRPWRAACPCSARPAPVVRTSSSIVRMAYLSNPEAPRPSSRSSSGRLRIAMNSSKSAKRRV